MTSIAIKQIAKFKTQEEAEWTQMLIVALQKRCRNIDTIVIQRKTKSWGSTGIRAAIAQYRKGARIAWINLAKLSYTDAEGFFQPDYDVIAELVNYFNSAEVQSFWYRCQDRRVLRRLTEEFGCANIARELMTNAEVVTPVTSVAVYH